MPLSSASHIAARYSRLGGATGVQPKGNGGKMMANFMY